MLSKLETLGFHSIRERKYKRKNGKRGNLLKYNRKENLLKESNENGKKETKFAPDNRMKIVSAQYISWAS